MLADESYKTKIKEDHRGIPSFKTQISFKDGDFFEGDAAEFASYVMNHVK